MGVSVLSFDLGTQHTGKALLAAGFTTSRGAILSTRLYEVVGLHVDATTWKHPDHGKLYLAEVAS